MTGDVLIGQGEGRPLNVLATGSLSGRAVRISALDNIELGASAQVLATTVAALASSQGNVALGEGSLVRGGTVALSGAGALTGSGTIVATSSDVGLTFCSDHCGA